VDGQLTSPVITPGRDGTVFVTFRWRGEAISTEVTWGVRAPMIRQPGSDLWEARVELPADLTTLYYFAHDGVEAVPPDTSGHGPVHVDPGNPDCFLFPADPADPDDRDSWFSRLVLPESPAETWSSPDPAVPHGQVTDQFLPGGRRVGVYLPAGVDPVGLPAMVVFDGYNSQHVLRIPDTLDNLIAADRIPPVVALFLYSPDAVRNTELSASATMTALVASTLIPWARDRYGISSDPAVTTLAGSSLGGLMATHLALECPETFGAVIAQSGSFWWPAPQQGTPGQLIREVAGRPRVPLRFYLDVGDHETLPGPGGGPSQVTMVRAMRDALLARGYPLTYAEYTGAHDYVNWRRTFADALIAIYGVTP
jgi:enterochelin esterase-like enzyme